jgi:hypothetical protein
MKEFSSISVSSYDAASLAERLTEKSAQGWEIEAIVPAGTNITAYLSRAAGTSNAAGSTTSESATSDSLWAATSSAEAATPAASIAAAATAPMPTTAAAEVPTTVQTAQPAQATQPATSNAPAGWYPDPAGRYELRYWDGGQWTEHVSRGGQQYTDPPVA